MIPLNIFGIIPGLINIGHVKSYFLDQVELSVSGTDQLKEIKYFRQSSKGQLVSFGDTRDPYARTFISGIHIGFRNNEAKSFKEVSVKIGEDLFTYDQKSFFDFWSKEPSNKAFPEYELYRFPSELKKRSILTNLVKWNRHLSQVVNWTAQPFLSLFKLILFIIFLISLGIMVKTIFLNKKEISYATLSDVKYEKIIVFGVCFIFFILALHFARVGIDVHHQGFVFHAAVRLLEGKILFKEIFYHYGPLTAILHTGSMLVAGKNLYAINALTAIFYFFNAGVFYLISKRFFKKNIALLGLVLWMMMAPFYLDVFIPWSSIYALFFSLLALLLLFKFWESEKKIYLFASGCLVALCFWTRQSVGPLIFIALQLGIFFKYLIENKKSVIDYLKTVLISLSGTISITLIFIFWLYKNSALGDWYLQNISGQSGWAFGGPINRLKTILLIFDVLLPINFWIVLPFATIMLLIFMAYRILKKDRFILKDIQLVSLCIFGLASWPQYFPVPCNRHFFWSSTPMFICLWLIIIEFLIPFLLQQFQSKRMKEYICVWFFTSLVFASLGQEIFTRFKSGIEKTLTYKYTIELPSVLKGIRVNSLETKDNLEKMDKYLSSYVSRKSHTSIVGEEKYNQLFMTFVKDSKLASPIPSSVFDYGILIDTYKFREHQDNFIEIEKPIIYSDKPLSLKGYKEYFHLSFSKPLDFQAQESYFYVPEE
jgi:hypothetical protein